MTTLTFRKVMPLGLAVLMTLTACGKKESQAPAPAAPSTEAAAPAGAAAPAATTASAGGADGAQAYTLNCST